MTTKQLNYKSLPSLAIAEGDTSPNPGQVGVIAWSSILSKAMQWNGSAWKTMALGTGTVTGTNTGDQTSVSGNAGTATALATARNIDGQSFDGTANITVIAPGTHAATSKTTPVDADEVPLVDSAASNVLKKLTWANIKATLKTYFDGLYPSGSGTSTGTNTGDQTITLTGDATGSGAGSFATTLATVNTNVGSFGSTTAIPNFTVNAKGLITAASTSAVVAPAGTLTGATLAAGVTASSLTSVGTIATGVWSGTAVAVDKGGTNLTSYAVGDLLYASATTTLSKLADVAVGSYLRSGGVTTAPLWSTTTLPNSAAVGDLIYASATNVYSNLADVAAGSYLRSGGVTTAPVWSTTTLPNSATTGDLIYASASNVYSNLAGVATGKALISGGVSTAPSWGQIPLTTHVSGILPAANGGTGIANNAASTITISGSFATTFTLSGTTTVTLPTSGTLATTAQLPVGANPSASLGLTAVNGSATSFMRSDGAPALSVAISPTWTGNHTYAPASGDTTFTAGNVGINVSTPKGLLSVKTADAADANTNSAWSTKYLVIGPNCGSTTGAALGFGYDTTNSIATIVSLSPNVAWKPIGFYASREDHYISGALIATIDSNGASINGNLTLITAGKGISIKEGTNACMNVATLVAGTAVVNTTKVTANSRIFLTAQNLGTITVPVGLAVSARTAGTSFTILSGNLTDTSLVAWHLFEPA